MEQAINNYLMCHSDVTGQVGNRKGEGNSHQEIHWELKKKLLYSKNGENMEFTLTAEISICRHLRKGWKNIMENE